MHRSEEPTRTNLESLLTAVRLRCGEGECEQAIAVLEEAIRLQPGSALLHFQAGFCHSGACREHRLVAPDMAERYLDHALLLAVPAVAPLLRARILDTLANLQARRFRGTAALKEAIAHHAEAAAIYRHSGCLEDWAREEFNEANSWCDLPDTGFPEKWAEAVAHFENALRVRNDTGGSKRRAATLTNLGTALRELPSGDKERNILRAMRCFRAALQVYRREGCPNEVAENHNNMANACVTCPSRNGAARARRGRYALRHFERALEVWRRETDPQHHAVAQYNRGCVYAQFCDTPDHEQKAQACFADALDCARYCGNAQLERLAEARLEHVVTTQYTARAKFVKGE